MDHGRRRFALWLPTLLASPLAANGALFDDGDVHAIVGPDNEQQRAIVAGLRRHFAGLRVSSAASAAVATVRPLVHIAVGPVALREALHQRLNAPLISMFASRQSFMRSMANAATSQPATAIHAEPSPAQQMHLISAIYKRTVTVGALVSEQSAFMVPELNRAADQYGQELAIATADPGLSLSRNLLRLASAKVLLIFPDITLYTPSSLREMLETSYRRGQPVIGFSESLVRAGTMASAFSSIDDMLVQLQSVAREAAAGRLPGPQYPRFWRVAVNESVARSLDVVIDSDVVSLGDRP